MLERVVIKGLFDTFTYSWALQKGGITILTGPNGFGKSTIFRLIEAAANGNIEALRPVPFDEIGFYFSETDAYFLHKQGEKIVLDGRDIQSSADLIASPAFLRTRESLGAVRLISGHDLNAAERIGKLSPMGLDEKKIALFTDLINGKLRYKKLIFSVVEGVYMTDLKDGTMRLPLSALSSGEQQILVFYFSLIFETPKGALLLIDEPEISLHIVWQMALIGDLMRILEADKGDTEIVIATHSPQILTGNWDLQVDLGELHEG